MKRQKQQETGNRQQATGNEETLAHGRVFIASCLLPVSCLLLFFASTSGCQLVNEADLSFLDDPPGGDADTDTDSDTDTDTDTDTDPCVGASCGINEHCDEVSGECVCDEGFRLEGGVCVPIPIEDCAAAGDEDFDGFANCADFDCIGTSACCGDVPDPAVDANFAASIDTGLWSAFLVGRSPTVAGGGLDFADHAEGNGLFFYQPVDISGGLEVSLSGLTGGDTPCDSPVSCIDYAGVALTRVITFVEGVPLPTSLAVLVTAGGGVLVTRGGVVRGRGAVAPGPFDVRVRVTPAISIVGEAGFAVTVTDHQEVEVRTVWASVDPVMDPVDNLLIDGSQGAKVAVVGRTSDAGNAKLSTLTATPLSCANPSGWTLLSVATRQTLGIDTAEWATGSFGAPTAISATEVGAEGIRILFDASNLDPFFEIYGDVNKAIGEAGLWRDDVDGWVWEPGVLVIGEVEPNCIDGDCSPSDSQPDDARGPGGFRNPGGTFAFVLEDQGRAIRLYDRSGSPWRLRGDSPLWEASTYTYVRWRGVAAVSRQLALEDLCVFALGEDDVGSVFLHTLCAEDVPALAAAEFGEALLSSADFWPLAARGMGGLVVTWDDGLDDPGDEAFRLWTVGTDAGRDTGILHAVIGPEPDVEPVVQPYAGNPVLRGDSEFLGPCDGECRLSGVGAVEVGDLRRVVVGRQVDADVTDFEIFALEQNR